MIRRYHMTDEEFANKRPLIAAAAGGPAPDDDPYRSLRERIAAATAHLDKRPELPEPLVEHSRIIADHLQGLTMAIDDAEEAGYRVTLFIVPDGEMHPTIGIEICPSGPHSPEQSITMGEIEFG